LRKPLRVLAGAGLRVLVQWSGWPDGLAGITVPKEGIVADATIGRIEREKCPQTNRGGDYTIGDWTVNRQRMPLALIAPSQEVSHAAAAVMRRHVPKPDKRILDNFDLGSGGPVACL